jgi:hypothetical protein
MSAQRFTPTGLATLSLFMVACGDDHGSRSLRFEDPVSAGLGLRPVPVPAAADAAPCLSGTVCCASDADCDDGEAATLDVCEGTTCVYTANPDGCVTDSDCTDADPCTREACVGADGAAVANDEAGHCAFRGASDSGCCLPSTTPVANFDSGTLGGVYVTDNAESGVFWQTDDTRGTSGAFALYAGDPVSQTYASGTRVKTSATTRPLEIPGGGRTDLVFDAFKATRATRNFDVLQVAVLRDEGLFSLWSSRELADGTTGGAWQTLRVPLSDYAGQRIQLRFIFDSGDAPPPGLEGTYLDTLHLETRCD